MNTETCKIILTAKYEVLSNKTIVDLRIKRLENQVDIFEVLTFVKLNEDEKKNKNRNSPFANRMAGRKYDSIFKFKITPEDIEKYGPKETR